MVPAAARKIAGNALLLLAATRIQKRLHRGKRNKREKEKKRKRGKEEEKKREEKKKRSRQKFYFFIFLCYNKRLWEGYAAIKCFTCRAARAAANLYTITSL